MDKVRWFILALCAALIVWIVLESDLDNFWEMSNLFRFAIPLLTIIIVLLSTAKKRKNLRETTDSDKE